MIFEWGHVLELAKHLASIDAKLMESEPEAYYRSSVSRAYYASHTAVRDWLTDNTQYSYTTSNNSDGVHKDIINRIGIFVTSATAGNISRHLDSLRAQRVDADYELMPINGNWDRARAEDAIDTAELIFDYLSRSIPRI